MNKKLLEEKDSLNKKLETKANKEILEEYLREKNLISYIVIHWYDIHR